MPSKPLNTDDPLELAEGWDREADKSAPPAADPQDDWDTPLDDVSWDEPTVKNVTEEAAPSLEEVLPPVTGDNLVEISADYDIDATPSEQPEQLEQPEQPEQPEDDDDPFAEPDSQAAPPPEPGPPGDPPPQEPATPEENQGEADEGSAYESEAAVAGEDSAATADIPAAPEKAKPLKVELDLEGMQLESDLTHQGEDEDEEDDNGKESAEVDDLPPELEVGQASWLPSGKITLAKLLLFLVPAALLAAGLTFMGYRLFFSSSAEIAEQQFQDVWPAPVPVGPGDWRLEPFFFLLSGPQAQEPVELIITVFYDQPELILAFKDDLPRYRDYIFRYIQQQDAGILTDPARQEKLQSDLRNLLNQKLGAPAITYLGFAFTR